MSTVFKTIIITAENADFIKQTVNQIPAAYGMFSAPYSKTGTIPAEYYISEGSIGQEFALALTDPNILIELLKSFNIEITLEYAQKLLSETIVSDNPASEEIAKLNIVPLSYGDV